MDIQEKIKEATAEHEKMSKQLALINRAKGDAEVAIIKLVSKIETLSELLPKEEKKDESGTK